MRFRFRFSLRTLLLAALLCGSGMLLYRNRAPWQVCRTITESEPIFYAQLSTKGRYFFTQSYKIGTEKDFFLRRANLTIRVYETESARLVSTITRWEPFNRSGKLIPGEAQFSPGENYVIRVRSWGTTIWNVADGKLVTASTQSAGQVTPLVISEKDSFGLFGGNFDRHVVSLPSLERAPVFDETNTEKGEFSTNEKWVGYIHPYTGNELILRSTPLQEKEQRVSIAKSVYKFQFSPDNRVLAYTFWGNDEKRPRAKTTLVDMNDFHSIAVFEGWLLTSRGFTNDGRCVTLESLDGNLAVHEIASKKKLLSVRTHADARLRIIGQRLIIHDPLECYDLATGTKLWSRTPSGGAVTDDGAFIINNPYLYLAGDKWRERLNSEYVLDAETGETSYRFDLPAEGEISKYFHFSFGTNPRRLLSVFATRDPDSKDPRSFQAHLWQHRRPPQWYGLAWLWEFWLCVMLGAAVIWSTCTPAFRQPTPSP